MLGWFCESRCPDDARGRVLGVIVVRGDKENLDRRTIEILLPEILCGNDQGQAAMQTRKGGKKQMVRWGEGTNSSLLAF